MTQELARYMTALIADDIDNRQFLNTDMSAYECVQLENALKKDDFAFVQTFLAKKLAWDKQNKQKDNTGRALKGDKL